ncbi:UDP-N-acetylglucosamine 2-epimerase (hydrolyzing) [Paenibacillus rigui]|uniref:UDP-N-acetylglucosamine 2-epimerase (Hydrolyzing) n=1 Tax=Paenibacillus rigui TaxID=554312 RepID=A0A229UI59_9BACL|nr:UDP-N-acetylglucosamine 2-epimerase [Paenibacillus rigui]OXM83054.1 UDP-N-acetylglucosamine 2-epimerase (hydrolyzing) [Paenibacillus rigui]
MRRKICIITGSRAEYGLLHGLMREIAKDPDLSLVTAVTGAHLSPEYGETYTCIEKDGFEIHAKIPLDLSDNTPVGMAKAVGQGVSGFAESLSQLSPDLVVVLGDRYEILAAAQAALLLNVPIAHIHGGEITEGAIDNSIRHAITKMAHLHFVAAEPYRKRVIQMGEDPRTVFDVGSPGLDFIDKVKLISLQELEEHLGFPFKEINFLVTLHPETMHPEENERMTIELLAALDHFPEASIIITMPNADTGSETIRRLLEQYALQHAERVRAIESLGHLYINTMLYSAAVIGNSSSGIIEAPALKKPTINIGDRQKGRLRAHSVLDVQARTPDIVAAIQTALSDTFCESISKVIPPYRSANSSFLIKEILKQTDAKSLLIKSFYDVELNL